MGHELVRIGPHLMTEAVDGLLGDYPWWFQPGNRLIWMCGCRECWWYCLGHLLWVEAWGLLLLLILLHPLKVVDQWTLGHVLFLCFFVADFLCFLWSIFSFHLVCVILLDCDWVWKVMVDRWYDVLYLVECWCTRIISLITFGAFGLL